MSEKLVIAAARAHALVSLSDGRTAWLEAHGFAARMRRDPAFSGVAHQQLEDASAAAFAAFKGDERFDDEAHAIALLLNTREEREAVLRAAQAALVADGANRDQENDAIAALARAMNLNPRKA